MFVLATFLDRADGRPSTQPRRRPPDAPRAVPMQYDSPAYRLWPGSRTCTLLILPHGPLTLGMPGNSLLPIFAIQVLHGGAGLQGLLLTLIGIGSVVGALIVASSATTVQLTV